jgi:preprotein translocase subunit SecA
MKILKNFFAPYKQILNRAKDIAFQVEDLESKYSTMSEEQMKDITNQFIEQIKNKEVTTDDIIVEAFALVREIAYRVHNMKAYHVQLVGAAVVHYGDFAEMATGEGKTLTLLFPIYLNALEKKGVHVVSVNEYLVERDAHFCRLVLEKLGLTVGFNLASHPNFIKRGMYSCDVTYTTNSELGFDYLRDNMVTKIEDKVQRSLAFAIVDEGDSILIDEARTPLIISGGQEKDSSVYTDADKCVKAMSEDHYIIDRETQTISLTPAGVDFAQKFLNVLNLYDVNNSEMVLRINNALMANYIFMNGVQYIVREGKVLLVDQSTGRIMEGRAYSNGLNQSIQAKEMIEIEPENATVATITYQSFFRLYKKLAAVSGTAVTESEEFLKIYNMIVAKIPTNKPVIRNDLPNTLFARKKDK